MLCVALMLGMLIIPAHAEPILHWKFDESSGLVAADSAPAGPGDGNNAGTLNGLFPTDDSQWVPGRAGNALRFSANEDRVVNDDPNAFYESFTVSLWVRTTDTNQSEFDSAFASSATGGGTTDTFQIDFDGSHTRNYRFVTRPADTAVNFGTVANDTWQHLAATVDGTNLTLYLDGSPVNSGTMGMNEGGRFNDFVAGSNRNDNRFFDGLIDDVQLYDTALSGAQIQFLHENPGQLVPEPGACLLLGLIALAALFRRPAGTF
jgi:hypothetical protein